MKHHRLLLVDDSQVFLQRLLAMLAELEPVEEIHTANNYEQALAVLERTGCTIVLLDIDMPGRNGLQLLRSIKKRNHNVSVIMLSNQNNDIYRKESIKLGASFFVDKTAEIERLPALINSFSYDMIDDLQKILT
ncbi:response regulator transcription factor [Nostoc ellipsosporum NOK]|jgi:DNA-binding NarL/FixJ family response regulator|nr:response regulator transcription factor [Nostoc ellipsosporum NOK]